MFHIRNGAPNFLEIKEFRVRYIGDEARSPTPISDISDLQIILDYWSIHHVMINAYTWIGTIFKDDDKLGMKLINLIEIVEIFWHKLENNHPKELQSRETAVEFNDVLKNLCLDQRQFIAKEIRDHLTQEKEKYDKDIKEILKYFKKNIPDVALSVKIRKKLFKGRETLKKLFKGDERSKKKIG